MTDFYKKYFDAIIIGAGPAGTSAAFFLAEKGAKVLILEKEKFPRYKVCGGGVVNRIKKILPYALNEVIEREFYTVEIFDHATNLHFKTIRKEPIIMMSMRQDLDSYMLSKALEAGASIKEGNEVSAITSQNNCVEISTNRGKYYSKFIIAADGVMGISSKLFEMKNNILRLPAIEAEVEVSKEKYSRLFDYPRFDFGIINKGYAWVFPKKNILSIGLVLMKKDSVNLNETYKEYLKILGIDGIFQSEKHGYIIPIHRRINIFGKGRLLITGDAAGIADPVTAEGISSAVLSGFLAADALIEKKFDERYVSDYYNLIIAHEILEENRYAHIISNLVYANAKVRASLFKLYGQRLSELITDIFSGEKEYNSLMTNPVNYYKLLKYLIVKSN